MEIRLDLSKHCIETEIKKSYNKALSEYFKSGTDKNHIERTIEFTQHALKILDFRTLRSNYPALCGNTDHDVVLSILEDKITIFIDGKPISPIAKKTA